MSTTRSTPDLPYTVVGGRPGTAVGSARHGVSAVVLDRSSGPTRAEALGRIAAAGVDEVLAVLGPHPHYEVEQLAERLPNTRFLLLGRPAGVGESLNVAIRECISRFALVIWSDMQPAAIPDRVIERLGMDDLVCAAPVIRTERGESLPSQIAPAFHGPLFRTVAVQPGVEGGQTLYPYADTGIYNRERFERIGGFDPAIGNPYWQRLDFGMRAHLWGESIRVLPALRVEARRPPAPEDATADIDYARFHLKNLAVRFYRDQARLPLRHLIPFLGRSGLAPGAAVREFLAVHTWVKEHRYRFTQDARRLTEFWEVDP